MKYEQVLKMNKAMKERNIDKHKPLSYVEEIQEWWESLDRETRNKLIAKNNNFESMTEPQKKRPYKNKTI